MKLFVLFSIMFLCNDVFAQHSLKQTQKINIPSVKIPAKGNALPHANSNSVFGANNPSAKNKKKNAVRNEVKPNQETKKNKERSKK